MRDWNQSSFGAAASPSAPAAYGCKTTGNLSFSYRAFRRPLIGLATPSV